jgi:hypothetical protein
MIFVLSMLRAQNLRTSFFSEKKKEVFSVETDVRGKEPHEILLVAIEKMVENARFGETLIYVSDDPRVKMLISLKEDGLDQYWAKIRDVAREKALTLGYKSLHSNELPEPVNYGTDQEISYEDLDIFMEALKTDPGSLVNQGRLILQEDHTGLLTEKKTVFKVIVVPSFYLEAPLDRKSFMYTVKMRLVGIGDTRLTRIFKEVPDPRIKPTSIEILENGSAKNLRLVGTVVVVRLMDEATGKMDPLALFEASPQPAHWVKQNSAIERMPLDKLSAIRSEAPISNADLEWVKYRKSSHIIRNGIPTKDGKYIFGFVSSSGQKELSPNMLREDVTIPEQMLKSIDKEYLNGPFKDLTEIEKLYDILSYGAYLKHRGKESPAAKASSRFGLVLSTSVALGQPRARSIGRVRVPFSNYIETEYRRILSEAGFDNERIDTNIQKLKIFWKEDAADGFNIVAADWLCEALNKAGIYDEGKKWTEQTVLGAVVQHRYAVEKGLARALPREIFDSFSYVNDQGIRVYPYKGFDMIIEKNSLKLEWAPEVFKDELAPQFELVAIGKSKGCDMLDAQLAQCFQFKTPEAPNLLKERLAENFSKITKDLMSHDVAKISSGVKGHAYFENQEKSPFGVSRSWLEGYLQASDVEGPIEEPYAVRAVFGKRFSLSNPTRFSADAERLYMEPDWSVFWKGRFVETGEIDFLSGMPLFDIFVDGPQHATLSKPDQVWCGGRKGRVASYRNPLNLPGEIVFSNALGTEEINDPWMAEILSWSRPTIVFSVFSASANLMAGGDFDGDMPQNIWDKRLLQLLFQEDFVLVDVTSKAHNIVVNYENLKVSFSNSLCNAGIGIITNYGTTWSELLHFVNWNLMVKPDKVSMPKVHYLTFDRDGFRRLQPAPLHRAFFQETKVMKGVVPWAKIVNQLYPKMPDWERQAVMAIANLTEVEELMAREELSFEEFERFASYMIPACKGAISVVRFLQELAINTSKSDVWALYTREINPDGSLGKLVPSERYNYISLFIRPRWKRPFSTWKKRGTQQQEFDWKKNSFEIDYTPMGVVTSFVRTVYMEMYKKCMSASVPIQELILTDLNTPLYKQIDTMVKEYNARLKQFMRASDDEDDVNKAMKLLSSEYQAMLYPIIYSNNLMDVLRAAYTATYKNGDKDGGRRLSFVYSLLQEELLVYLNNRSHQGQRVPIPVKTLEGYAFGESGIYTVAYNAEIHRTVIYSDDEAAGIAPCKLDGEAEVVLFENRPFIMVDVPRTTKKVANKDFGRDIRVIAMNSFDFSEQSLLNSFKFKIGCKAEAQAERLGQHQDFVRFKEDVYVNEHGVESSRILMLVDGTPSAIVAPEYEHYVRNVLKYGDQIIVEWVKSNKVMSKHSATLKLIDAIAK